MSWSALVVDDEEVIREGLLALPWKALGFDSARSAQDGAEALQLLEASPADLVLTDIRMPVLDGLGLSNAIRERWPRTRTIILTGYREFEDIQVALRARVVDYILKPMDPLELESIIREVAAGLDAGQTAASRRLGEELDSRQLRWAVQEAIRLVKDRLSCPPTLAEVAARGNMHPSYFSLQFKKAVGMNYVDYLRKLRIEEAERLLKESELRIYEIGAAVGYHDAKHFAQTFKEVTGLSPIAYRQR
jgi:Response regulator containing CheY-like receiver domain and AraC-type DNA-binding domain